MRRLPLLPSLAAMLIEASAALAFDGPPPARSTGAIGALVAAVRAGDVAGVERLRDAAGPVGVRIATWRILREGIAGDFTTFAAFEGAHQHWPNMNQVRAQAEYRLEGQPPQVVIDWFTTRQVQTTVGALALLAAQEETGQDTTEFLHRVWTGFDLSEAQEQALLARYGARLAAWHAERLDALLWRDERAQAERMIPRVDAGHQRLARARLALQARADGVDAMIAAVPEGLADDPGLAYDRFYWRLGRGLTDSATELLLERSPDRLGRPERWAAQRARLARRALDAGDARLAYDLAARHGLTEGVELADLEWLAGYVALRSLNRPQDALHHFVRLRDRVSSPISLGRAGYWEGRAQEAIGDAEAARTAYAFGAQFQTAYYGQLAAERLGLTLDPAILTPPPYPDWHDTALARSDLFEAARLLYAAGQWYEARRFTLQLAETLTSEAELGALAQYWLERNEANFALKIAKEAVTRGIVLPRAYFPVTDLAEADLRVPPDLALAIARRESEFDHRVTSHADARGLMQVLPATGAHTARRIGVDFDESRLTTDAAYNAVLGAGYLEELSDLFGGTLSLVSAGYNAGPGRPRRWIQEHGDPRDAATDPVDWVEMIPFTETRNYVMRVTEAVVIYRALLAGQSGPIGLTDILRGRD
ncbi:MAG: lytic transglycosylase domain-containing protein [Rhodobacter sp.]|nr:lytic transglycosylase domain-containing protein [Paracoccaceae bacterium]MCC0076219.1 lytic transglycosylase domain-containing protein [Rhodobacter sp.]